MLHYDFHEKDEETGQYQKLKSKFKVMNAEYALQEHKKKETVEAVERRSRIIASAWKNNVLECFDDIVKYWTFHGKHGYRDNRFKMYLENLTYPDPNSPPQYLEFCVDCVDLLRTGANFEKGMATVMSTIFNLWNNYMPKNKYGNHITFKSSSGTITHPIRVISLISRNRNFGIDISAFFKFVRASTAHYGDDPTVQNIIYSFSKDLPAPFRNKAPETSLVLAFDPCYALQRGLKYFFTLVLEAAQTDSILRIDLENYVNYHILQDVFNSEIVNWPSRTEIYTLQRFFLNVCTDFHFNHYSNCVVTRIKLGINILKQYLNQSLCPS